MTIVFSDLDPANRVVVTVTASIVTAYVSNNFVATNQISSLIDAVHGAVSAVAMKKPETAPVIRKATEAQIRRSIMDDGLISFIDGQKYKLLSRHLAVHGMSFTEYRLRYGLPHDYPSISADLRAQRAGQAAANGIGTRYGRFQGRKRV